MKKAIITTILVLLMFLLQTSIFNYISFSGIVPNLLLMLVSVYGFMRGDNEGMILGFCCGLLIDVLYMDMLGFYALMYLYIGYFNSLCHIYYTPGDFRLPIILISLSDLLSSGLCYVFLFLFNGKLNFEYYFVHIALPELIYTLGVAILIYPCLLLLEQKVILTELIGRKKDAL